MSPVERDPELAQLIADHRDEIAQGWSAAARAMIHSDYGMFSAEEVRGWLSKALDVFVESLVRGSEEPLKSHLFKISLARFEMGFRLDDVASCLMLLKEVVAPLIWRAFPAGDESTRSAFRSLDAASRMMISSFSSSFGEELRKQAEKIARLEARQRIARDLHDSVTQYVYAVTLLTEAASRQLDAGQNSEAVASMREAQATALTSLRELRLLIFELLPSALEKGGLVEALRARLAAVEGRAGLKTELSVEGTAELPKETERQLYRIAQETLNNVLKHAGAGRVRLHLLLDPEELVMEVVDNGRGFDLDEGLARGGLGLRGMYDRVQRLGARLEIESAPERGTTVRIRLHHADDGGTPRSEP